VLYALKVTLGIKDHPNAKEYAKSPIRAPTEAAAAVTLGNNLPTRLLVSMNPCRIEASLNRSGCVKLE